MSMCVSVSVSYVMDWPSVQDVFLPSPRGAGIGSSNPVTPHRTSSLENGEIDCSNLMLELALFTLLPKSCF